MQTPVGPKVETFPVGVTIRDEVDGNQLEKTSSWEGAALATHVRTIRAGQHSTFRSYLRGDNLVLEMRVGDVVCRRVFSRKYARSG